MKINQTKSRRKQEMGNKTTRGKKAYNKVKRSEGGPSRWNRVKFGINELVVDVPRGKIKSAYICSFLKNDRKEYEILAKAGYNLITLEDIAKLVLQKGFDSFVAQRKHCTSAAIVRVPDKRFYPEAGKYLSKSAHLVRNLHLFPLPANESKEDFYKRHLDKLLEDSIKLPNDVKESWMAFHYRVPTNEFAKSYVMAYAFGGKENAENLGSFLYNNGVKELGVYDDACNRGRELAVDVVHFEATSGIGCGGGNTSLLRGTKKPGRLAGWINSIRRK